MTGNDLILMFPTLIKLMITQETDPQRLRDTLALTALLGPEDRQATLVELKTCALAKTDHFFGAAVRQAIIENSAPWN